MNTIKVIVIGNSGVGKTRTIKKICNSSYDGNKTIGVDFDSKVFIYNNLSYKILFWDCAGDSRFNNIIRSYYNNTKYIAIFFDADSSSFEEDINYWRSELNHNLEINKFKIIYIGIYDYEVNDITEKYLINNKYNYILINRNNFENYQITNPLIDLFNKDHVFDSKCNINTKLLSENESKYRNCCGTCTMM